MSKYHEGSFWYYAPNKGAPIAFSILFAISVAAHCYHNSKYHWWKTLGVMPWAGIVFIAALVLRAVAAFKNGQGKDIFIASSVLVSASPPVYAAANYIILSRTLYYIPYLAPLHPGRVLSTFLGLDGLIGALVINGSALLMNRDNSPATIRSGSGMVKAGLLLQLAVCVLFLATAATFHARGAKRHVLSSGSGSNRRGRIQTLLAALYVSTAFIIVRSIYATVATFEGLSALKSSTGSANRDKITLGPTIRHEWFFWVFDAAVLLLNTSMWNVMHPARFLPGDHRCYLATDGVTERIGPGWVDKRPFLLTVLDPFDIAGLVSGRDRKQAFWEEEGGNPPSQTALPASRC